MTWPQSLEFTGTVEAEQFAAFQQTPSVNSHYLVAPDVQVVFKKREDEEKVQPAGGLELTVFEIVVQCSTLNNPWVELLYPSVTQSKKLWHDTEVAIAHFT